MSIYDGAIRPGQIHQVFPTPVYLDHLNREFTPSELEFARGHVLTAKKNQGNLITGEDRILDQVYMADIRLSVEKCLEDYVRRVYAPADPIEVYVTQSWLNYTDQGQHHHSHYHPNSFLSGVLYFDVNSLDRIVFMRPHRPCTFAIDSLQENTFNSTDWAFPLTPGMIVIFPSTLEHRVDEKVTGGTRISLAFNTWIRGTLGSPLSKNHLVLP